MAEKLRILALFQQGAFAKNKFAVLEKNTCELYKAHFGNHYKLTFVWLEIPQGQAYIAGKPSTATTITMPVKNETINNERHAFMSAMCEMWIRETGCSENEIILSVMDKALSEQYTKASLARLNPQRLSSQLLRLLVKLLISKLTKGRFQLSVNIG